MANIISEYLASIGFKADEASLKKALTRVTAFATGVKLATAGIYAGLMQVANSEVAIANKAKALGLSSAQLQELHYIAEQTGGSVEGLNSALQGLVNKYPRLKDANTALAHISRRMRGMNEQQRKFFASRMGIDPSLIPMLTEDVSGLKSEFAQMYAVAGVNAEKAAQSSREFIGEIGKIKTVAGMLAKSVSHSFIGKIKGDVYQLRKAIMEHFGSIKKVLEFVISIVLRLSGIISAFVYRAIKVVSNLVDWFGKLDDSQQKLILGVFAFMAAWKLLNLSFLATPLGMLITGLLAIVALVDDYLTYMEGGESYFDWGPWAETIEEVVTAITGAIGTVGKYIQDNEKLFTVIGKGLAVFLGFKAVVTMLGGSFRLVTAAVKILWGLLRANPLALIITAAMLIYEYWEPISEFFSNLWGKITGSMPDFGAWAENAKESIMGAFGKAIDWVIGKFKKLIDWLPDSVLDAMGFSDGDVADVEVFEDKPEPKKNGRSSPHHLGTNIASTQHAYLTPPPAQMARMQMHSAHQDSPVELTANPTINVYASDPVSAGREVANQQRNVNADVVRNMKGRAR